DAALDVAAAAVRLDATAVAARTRQSLLVPADLRVADLGRAVGRTLDERAVDDHAGTDTGADIHAEHVARTARHTRDGLAEHDRVDVVVDADREPRAGPGREHLAERRVPPAQVRRVRDRALKPAQHP